jgi:hypothetical protein
VVARVLAQGLSAQMGQPSVIDNRPGALRCFMTLVDPTPDAPWRHMRLFVFDRHGDRGTMLTALVATAATISPDSAERAQRAGHAATLRGRVGEADFDLLTTDRRQGDAFSPG